jgi:hypothetical protein
VPPVRDFLGLVAPTAAGWGAVAASSAAAVALSRTVGVAEQAGQSRWLAAWREEMRRLSAATAELLLHRPAALPAPQ